MARCVRLGKKESPLWSHDHSVLQMEIFDEVNMFSHHVSMASYGFILHCQVRRQGDYKFPEGAEKIL